MKSNNLNGIIPVELDAFFKNTTDMIFFKDADLVYRGASLAFARLVGLESGRDIIGKTDFDLFPEELAKRYTEDDSRLLKSGKSLPSYIEPLPDDKEKKPRFASTSKYPLRDEAGKIVGLCGIGRDISDQMELEQRNSDLLENANRYRIALSDIRTSVWDYDFATGSILQSPHSREIHGLDFTISDVPESLIQNGYIHPDFAEEYREMYRRLAAGTRHVEGVFRVKFPPDSDYWYEHIRYTSILDKGGIATRAVGMSEDVTDKYEAQCAYDRELNIQMVMASDIVNTLLIDVDDWRVVRAHVSSLSALSDDADRTPEEYAQAAAEAVVDDEEARHYFQGFTQQHLRERFQTGHQDISFEYRRRLAGSEIRWVRTEIRYVTDPSTGHLMLFHVLRDVDKERQKMARLTKAAENDAMTNLLNHTAAMQHMENFLSSCPEGLYALFMVDLDNFKQINDRFGHQQGDSTLVKVAMTIREVFSETDLVGRIGGDEFLVLMTTATHFSVIQAKAQELLSALQFKVISDNNEVDLSASIGVALTNGREKLLEQLYREVDTALYKAKQDGKNRWAVFRDPESSSITSLPDPSDQGQVMQLRTLLDHMDAGIIVADVTDNVRITYISPSFYKTMKRTEKEIGREGEKLLDLIYPDDMPLVMNEVRRAADGIVADCLYRVGKKGELWRHLRAARMPSETTSVIAVVTDVTDMIRAEEQLRLAEERYRIAMKQTAGLLWEVDLASHSLFQTPEVSRFFGTAQTTFDNVPESLIEYGLVLPESETELRRMFDDMYAFVEGNTYMIRTHNAEGGTTYAKMSYEFLCDCDGHPVHAVGVTEPLANVEPELRAFKDECRFLKEMAPSLINSIMVNLTTGVVEHHGLPDQRQFAHTAEPCICYGPGLPHGEDFDRLVSQVSRKSLLKAYKDGHFWLYFEYRRLLENGTARWTSLSINLIRHPLSGDIYGFGFYQDIDVVHGWEQLLGNLNIRRNSATFFFTRKTLSKLWRAVTANLADDARYVVTVLEMPDLRRISEEKGAQAAQRMLFAFGRLCRVVISGNATIGYMDETHAIVFRADFDSVENYKARCLLNNEQLEMILRPLYPDIGFRIATGFTVATKECSDFDELVRQATVACSLALQLPGCPICQYDPLGADTPVPENTMSLSGNTSYRILIVDDDRISRIQLRYTLESFYAVDEAENGEEALRMMEHIAYSLIISDIHMPKKTGWELLEDMKKNGRLADLPVIILTGDSKEESEIKALSHGATDVIVKPFVAAILLSRVQNTIGRQEAVRIAQQNRLYQLRIEQQEKLLQVAEYDEVTGLYNRQAFYRRVRHHLDEHPGEKFLIIRWDLDNFKMLNDFLGVSTGDRVLRDIATHAREVFSEDSLLARLESDHFVNFAPLRLSRFSGVYEEALRWSETYPVNFRFSFRIGIYVIDDPAMDIGLMCDRALMALRSVKNSYTTHIAYYDDSLRSKLVEEQELIREMHSALEEEQFELYFQPQYDCSGSENLLVGAEALVRWNHPRKGLLSPGSFVPLFEKNGFIMLMDQYVWDKACQYLRRWTDEGLDPPPLSVNISRLNVYDPHLVKTFCTLIEKYQLDARLLKLEITESAYADDPDLLIELVGQLREKGFFVEMDDFGSGYSSLNTLKEVPVDLLKLDMRFLAASQNDSRGGIVINSVLRMAHWLNLPVIAEGVETPRQAAYLKTVGCTLVQGYLYGRPMPEAEYTARIKAERRGVIGDQLVVDSFFNSNAFWTPEAQETVIFSSFVGAAGIFEYYSQILASLRLNDKFFKEIGLTRRDFKPFLDDLVPLVLPEDKEAFLAVLNETIQSDAECAGEMRLINPVSSKTVWLSFRARRIAKSTDRYVLYMALCNITDRKNAEALQTAHYIAERERNALLMESLGAIVFDYDFGTDMMQYDVNRPGKGVHHACIENFLSTLYFSKFVHPDFVDSYRATYAMAAKFPQHGVFEYLANSRGTGYRLNRSRWASIADEKGRVYRMVGIVTDNEDE